MANKTVYPYGVDGELPSSIGLVNDFVTGGVDKALTAEAGKVLSEEVVHIDDDYTDVDLNIQDNEQNTLVRFSRGHIKTKNFDSSINGQIGVLDDYYDSDLSICDPNGHILVRLSGGHIETKNFDSSNLSTNIDKNTIVCVGDSLTQGQGEGRVYPTILQGLVGNDYSVINLGGSGDKIQDVMARTDTYPAITSTDKTIPSSGAVSLGYLLSSYDNERKMNFMLQNPNVFKDVSIMGIPGTLTVSGSYESASYSFTRTESGNAVSVKVGCPIYDNKKKFSKGEILILWAGTNGLWDDEEELAEMLNEIVKKFGHDKYIVMGLTNKNYYYDQYTHSSFTPSTLKSVMLKKFGIHYLDVLGYLLTDALSDAGITPTQADMEAISNEEVPPSLLYDSVHFNSYGYTVIANKVYEKLNQLNYLQ